MHSQNFNSKRIYVGKLPKGTRDQDLTETFKGFGLIKSAYIINDSITNAPLNFGYVVFADVESAEKAISSDGIFLRGSKLVVRNYKSKPELEESKRTSQHSGALTSFGQIQP